MAAAKDYRESAYAPYSHFKVGAAVIGGSGKAYLGCNVENASYGLSVCAERVAIFRAISERETSIKAVVIVGGEKQTARPCGACLQVITEFSPEDDPTLIVTCDANLNYDVHTIRDYLPMPFALEPENE